MTTPTRTKRPTRQKLAWPDRPHIYNGRIYVRPGLPPNIALEILDAPDEDLYLVTWGAKRWYTLGVGPRCTFQGVAFNPRWLPCDPPDWWAKRKDTADYAWLFRKRPTRLSTPCVEGTLGDNNGEPMADYDGRVAEAQTVTTHTIDGHAVARIPWGQEKDYELTDPDTGVPWADPSCGNCGVALGQLHVETCDMEECPVCGEQWISCLHGSPE